MDDWQPLTDIWDEYNSSLDTAIEKGYIGDVDLEQGFVWPTDLYLGEVEQQDVQKYVHERLREIVDSIHLNKGLNPNLVAGYIFRSVICGMMWQKERIGR